MAKRRLKPGMFLAIEIPGFGIGYARVLKHDFLAFYKLITPTVDLDIKRISTNEIVFVILVRRSAVARWPTIGELPLEDELQRPIVQFDQDPDDYTKCLIWDTAGNEKKATPNECIGIEPSLVWEGHAAEARFVDTMLGRPNRTLEMYKVRLR